MSEIGLSCCSKKIPNYDVWLLQDIRGFTARKLFKGICPVCNDEIVLLVEKRITDGKTFVNTISHIEAVKTLYREKKRRTAVFPNVRFDNLQGWIYGVNTQIKNKKGEVVQLRQYSSDFKGKRRLSKKVFLSK